MCPVIRNVNICQAFKLLCHSFLLVLSFSIIFHHKAWHENLFLGTFHNKSTTYSCTNKTWCLVQSSKKMTNCYKHYTYVRSLESTSCCGIKWQITPSLWTRCSKYPSGTKKDRKTKKNKPVVDYEHLTHFDFGKYNEMTKALQAEWKNFDLFSRLYVMIIGFGVRTHGLTCSAVCLIWLRNPNNTLWTTIKACLSFPGLTNSRFVCWWYHLQ